MRHPEPRDARERPSSRGVSKGMSANRECAPTALRPRRRGRLARPPRWVAVAMALGLAATAALTAVNCVGSDPSPTRPRSATRAQAAETYAGTGSANVQLRPVDGGRDYYGRFSNSLPSDPSFFPVGLWLDSVTSRSDVAFDKRAGVNLYVGVADPEGSSLGLLRANGQKAFIQSNERTRFTGIRSETAGWLLMDEIDMTDGPTACRGRLQRISWGLPDDGRARYNNYGKGVLLWETNAEAACFVEAQQIVSSDLYWFTDPNQRRMVGERWLPERRGWMTLNEVRRAANYGYQVDRMRALDARDGRRKPIWNFVEVGWPFTESAAEGGRAIQPAEIRAAVWHSLIAGARGILYFDHQFGGPCPDRVLRPPYCYPENREMVKSVNRQIKDLAPVLNAPNATSDWTTNSSIRAMVKWHAGNFYVFAGSRENRASTGTFSLPCVGDATVERLGEGGSVPLSGGSFSDSFADGNAVHIYRIDGGSTCGLPAG
jgi:hypothetical protein